LADELGADLASTVIEQIEIVVKYAGYIGKQVEEVERAAYFEHLKLPAEMDYAQVPALSFEVRQKLGHHRPETLGQAARISGVTPAAISLLLVHLKKGRFKGFAGALHSSKGRASDQAKDGGAAARTTVPEMGAGAGPATDVQDAS
jgi:tRNA uridine 5-carboxymethylaminomethyl modification enzyme